MFDKLLESTTDKPQGRSKFYLAISAIYGVSLMVLGVLTIMWFNPMPAEAYERVGMIQPPPPTAPRPITQEVQRVVTAPRNLAPTSIPKDFVNPYAVKPAAPAMKIFRPVAGGLEPSSNTILGPPTPFDKGGVIDEVPLPIPTPKATPSPAPKLEVVATPAPKTITSVMIASKAIKKVQPPYPAIARSARVQGVVTVQVLISEEGRVVSASTVNGHPLLLDASVQAARQWVFSPTQLNGVPVKVSGVLTFNFTLN